MATTAVPAADWGHEEMTGYFANIARQSGLRFVKSRPLRAGTATHGAYPRSPQASPIDMEEVVEVPSILDTNHAMLSKTEDPPTRISEDARLAVRKRTDGLAMSDRPQTRVVSPEIHDQIHGGVPIGGLSGNTSSKGESQTVDPRPTRHIGEEEDSVGEQSETIHERRPNEFVTAVSSAEQQEQRAKKYFRRTAEILDGGAVERTDVPTILVQDIHEWIAAEPMVSGKSEGGEEGKHASSLGMQREVVSPWEPEPSVVRIAGTDGPEYRTRERTIKTIPDIQEQVLDLSIGTINVVIEDDAKPPQPAPARRSDSGQDKRDSRRSRSRLSRNYL